MKTQRRGFTLIELIVVLSVLVLLAAMLLPATHRAREESRRKSCNSNLKQIVDACTTYQEPNGDFFPAFMQAMGAGLKNDNIPASGQGSDGSFQPMPSLACLYPAYVDNVKIFGCPTAADKPLIAFRFYLGCRHNCFGFLPDPEDTGVIQNNADPAAVSGAEVGGKSKCSYFYDELTNFRDIGPGQAMACDADGQTWIQANGEKPDYPKGWRREPKVPNHVNGQNVMYFDGHVKWTELPYASRDPNDNIFCPQAGWGADTDAYLWDGVNARAEQK